MGFRVGGKIGGKVTRSRLPPPVECRIDDLDDPRSELPVGCLGWLKLGCLGWAKLGCLGWLKLGCLGWLKLGVSTVGLWGVSQLEDAPQQGVGNNTITAPPPWSV